MEPLAFRALIESLGFSQRDVAVLFNTNTQKIADMCAGRRPVRTPRIERLKQLALIRDRLAEQLIEHNTNNEQPTLPYDVSSTWEAHLMNQASRLAAWTLEGDGKTVGYRSAEGGRIINNEDA